MLYQFAADVPRQQAVQGTKPSGTEKQKVENCQDEGNEQRAAM